MSIRELRQFAAGEPGAAGSSGGGFAWGREGSLVYLLFETDAQVSGRFRDGYALGFGGSAGLLHNLSERWKVRNNFV